MKIQALFLIALLCTLQAVAQPKVDRKALKSELKAYMQSEVLPAVSAQRAKLDVSLSEAEQSELTEIREGLKALKEARKAKRAAMKEAGKFPPSREELTEAEKDEIYQARKTHRQLTTRAWVIVDNHETEVRALLGELRVDSEEWREGMKAIFEKYRPEGERKMGKGEGGPHRGKGHGKGMHKEGHHGKRGRHRKGPHMGAGRFLKPLHFVLFDPNRLPEELAEMEAFELDVFPNPSGSMNQVSYEVKTPGWVKIELINQRGEVVKTLMESEQAAGSYQEQVNLEGLQQGVYIYRVSTPDGVQTKKLIKK